MADLSTNILLIEDDISHASLLIRWLEANPEYRVKHVSSGLAGIDLALSSEWDLIVSDIDLPDINGLELCRQTKMSQPMMPVLLITAHEGIDYALKAIQYKVDDFLLKPFEKITLADKVKNLLETSRYEKSIKQVRVLAIGAHPDDVEIGCGGILLRHQANGDRICILTMSNGEQGGVPSNRLDEITNVALRLKSKLIVGNLPDTKITEGQESISFIKRAIDDFKPNVIYTHSTNDAHQDHRNVNRATMVAARGIPTIYCYQSPSATIDFRPGLFVDISEFITEKVNLISLYKSQLNREYLHEEVIRSTAKYWGRFCNFKEIEPLEVIRTSK
jgi:LmbE family N-acetylglucosaminyl deacetylase/CheY-like chemotaxis protein